MKPFVPQKVLITQPLRRAMKEFAESQLVSMCIMVYDVLTQPYTHMWCMSITHAYI